MMTIEYDREVQAVYIRLRPGVPYDHGHDLDTERRVDFGADGKPIGVELLNVDLGVDTSHLPQADEWAPLLTAEGISIKTLHTVA
jgi:uncharacterized protein YuzE